MIELFSPVQLPLRLAAAIVLIVLAAAAFALGGAADSLLTPLPGWWTGMTMIVAFGLAIALAIVLAEPVPWRLVRRLTAIGVLAVTLYLCGQVARGLYAVFAFSGDVERDEVTLMITGVGSDCVQLVDRSRPGPVREVAASSEVVDDEPRGQCVNVAVERTRAGAERLARDAGVVAMEDVGPCE